MDYEHYFICSICDVVDMLLPNSKFQKYTKMVIGLLLIAIILTPILKLISQILKKRWHTIPDFEDQNQQMENLIDLQKK